MAAYAALVSLMNIIDNIQNHPRLSTSLDKNQIASLGERIDFLLDFVENYNHHGGICKEEVEDLESQIAFAAYAAEDVIESHAVDQIRGGSTKRSLGFLQKKVGSIKKKVMKVKEKIQSKDVKSCSLKVMLDLQKIMEDMDSIKENVMKVKEEGKFRDRQPIISMPAASSRPVTTGKTSMVGFDGYLIQLLERLTGQQSDRQIIPIVGMGGIGKTTLARNVYEHLVIVEHFHIRAWVTVSQAYNLREILLETLSCLRESTGELDEKTEDQLGEQLYKALSGRRYLIVLDDMWSITAWDKIKFFFPENYNRSRIIVTTRISDIANHFGPSGLPVDFLNEDESWNLFCEKAFGQEGCPPQLEEIGKKIIKKCKGLPLSIVVIGGLLGKSSRTQEYWESVAKDMSSSTLNSADDNRCLNILSLSYSHLPVYLKPCFLYFGVFPEDSMINKSGLIKHWIAEGFIKPIKDQSLEEIAEGFIKDLANRNLILARPMELNPKLEACYIHDLLRDLCLRMAEKEKFFSCRSVLDAAPAEDKEGRIILIRQGITKKVYHTRVLHTSKSASFVRSLIRQRPLLPIHKSRLSRVATRDYNDSLDATLQQVNLRFLEYDSLYEPMSTSRYKLPSSVSLLWNLQTLTVTGHFGEVVAPSEIWEMPQLRHLEFSEICLPDPPPRNKRDELVLRNLQTLGKVVNFRCSEEACERMPNIIKLHIYYDDFSGNGGTSSSYCLHNIGCLSKLEELKCVFGGRPNRVDLLLNLTFPRSLKELFLDGSWLHWEDLTMIGSLPYLEVLILSLKAVIGPEWDPVEGQFLRLNFLGIRFCFDLTNWNADSSHFPVLEKLQLYSLGELKEIPPGIGQIPTLGCIHLNCCSVSAAISAIKILEEQESLGNEGLRVLVEFRLMEDTEEFRQQVALEGFTSHNFQLRGP